MADARDSASEELPPAAAAAVASAAKEISEQQAMNEELEAQIQDGVEELKRVSVLRKQMLIANASSRCARVPSQQQRQHQRNTCLQIQAELHRIHTLRQVLHWLAV